MAGCIGKQYLNIRSTAKSLQLHQAVFNHIRLYGFYWYWVLFGDGAYFKGAVCQLGEALYSMMFYGIGDL